MAAPKPEFTDSFVVQKDNYGDFIRLVRQNVIKYERRRPSIVEPVLPPEQKIPKLWFHIVLRTTMTSSLTLAVRIDNLYLVGFKTPAGVWWELGKEGDAHLISSSKWLGFGGSYSDLLGHKKGLDTVTLGRAEMTAAVDVLAEHGTKKLEETQQGAQADSYALPKGKLVKLVIMICEGVRFHTVYDTIDKEFNNVAAAKITQIEGRQVNEWDNISKAVLTWAVNPKAKFPELQKIDIKDRNDAARIVALVKDQN